MTSMKHVLVHAQMNIFLRGKCPRAAIIKNDLKLNSMNFFLNNIIKNTVLTK